MPNQALKEERTKALAASKAAEAIVLTRKHNKSVYRQLMDENEAAQETLAAAGLPYDHEVMQRARLIIEAFKS